MTEMAAGGRGSKRRRKREGLQRGERNRQWLLVFGWWLCWLPMVELMVGRPVMRVVMAEGQTVALGPCSRIYAIEPLIDH